MDALFLTAKTRIPRVTPGLLPRPHLVERLGQGLSAPLTLVSAPAGFGKTSLATQWVGGLGAPWSVAWVSLDAQDNDPVRFWGLVAASCDRALSREPSPFSALQGLVQAPQPPPATVLASTLSETLTELEAPLVLVLDDFHVLSNQGVLDSVARFLEALPDQVRVVLLSRIDPALPLARFRVRGLVTELRADDLRFDPDDAVAFLRRSGPGLTEAQARAIDAKTEGWAAGLQLVALSLGRRTDYEAFIRGFSGSDRLILEFLTEEVLASQPEEIRAFLLGTSVFDRWGVELCDALLSPPQGAAAMVRNLESANLFVVPLDEGGRWYRYHHLFTETLRARLRVTEPGAEADLLVRAARWYESQRQPEEALDLFLRVGRPEDAARNLEKVDYLARGEVMTLVDRLEALGEATVASHVRLTDLAAWSRFFSGRVAEAEQFMVRALEGGEGRSVQDHRYLEGSFASLRAFLHMVRGQVAEAVASARTADSLLGPKDYYPRSIIPFVFGSDLRLRGRLEEAMAEFGKITELGLALGSIWTICQGNYEQGVTAFQMGQLERAARILDAALALAEDRGAGQFGSVARLRAVRAEIHWARHEWDEAERQVGAVLGSARRSGMPNAQLEVLAIHIRLLWARGNREEALACWAEAKAIRAQGGALPRVAALIDDLDRQLEAETAGAGRTSVGAAMVSPREKEVLVLLGQGLSNREIAGRLFVSEATVKTHLHHLAEKLGAPNRVAIVAKGRSSGLI